MDECMIAEAGSTFCMIFIANWCDGYVEIRIVGRIVEVAIRQPVLPVLPQQSRIHHCFRKQIWHG